MAQIARIELAEFTVPTEEVTLNSEGAPVFAGGRTRDLTRWLVTIDTTDGVHGEYVPMSSGPQVSIGQTMELAPLLVGRDPLHREQISDTCKGVHRKTDHIGYGMLDICLWDVAGKTAGLPIVDLLGRYRTELPAYASTMHGDHGGGTGGGLGSPTAYADFAEHCAGIGYRGFKFHPISPDPASQRAIVGALGDRVGSSMDLMLDCSSELQTLAAAIDVGRACDDAGFFWYEDPMRDCGTSAYAHAQLRRHVRTPLLIGEHLRGLEPKADLLLARATDFLRADPDLDMGITGAIKIARLAESLGVDVEFHAAGPAQRHCMAAVRNSNYYELGLVHPVLGNPSRPDVLYACDYSDSLESVSRDGCVSVPAGPGLGVTYNRDFIDRHRTGAGRIFEA